MSRARCGKPLPQAVVDKIREVYAQGMTRTEIHRRTGLSRVTIRKYLKGYEDTQSTNELLSSLEDHQ